MNHPPSTEIVTSLVVSNNANNAHNQQLASTFADLAGQLAPRSRATYQNDMQHFSAWLTGRGKTLVELTRSDFIEYRQHLADSYAKATAGRMLSVARRILTEAVNRGDLRANPAIDIRGFKTGANETPHTALNRREAKELLTGIDTSTAKGQRDYALIMLLLRTGLRRAEAVALTVGDLSTEQGHQIATIQHGKGDKRRVVKLPVDVARSIKTYLEAAGRGRSEVKASAPLFVRFRKGTKASGGLPVATEEGLTTKAIELIVKEHAKAAGVEHLTPHGLRASFVTLALEGGASLHQVQYAAGHADPRTTERYQKRKLNLDDNGVDYIKI
jgi:site-specific recombinase XerD